MEFEFTSLSDGVVAAFTAYQKTRDLITRKQDLLDQVFAYHVITPKSILFLGFDPWILAAWPSKKLSVGLISDDVEKFLVSQGVEFDRIPDENLLDFDISADAVITGDEFFTYCTTEDEQIDKIEIIAEMANMVIVTTLRDYKNLTLRDKEFSQPTAIKNDDGHSVFLEHHNHEYKVKNQWISSIYENGEFNRVYGPFQRRPMFFKQLAKFSYDAGAVDFVVHKNLMYKSLLKKNYEHVISVKF